MTTVETKQNEAWAHVTKFYGQTGIKAACLQLQDHYGVNVTFLLFLVWCDTKGAKTVESWQSLYQAGIYWRVLAGAFRRVRRLASGKLKAFILKQEIKFEKRQLFCLVTTLECQGGQQDGGSLAVDYLKVRGAFDTQAAKKILNQ